MKSFQYGIESPDQLQPVVFYKKGKKRLGSLTYLVKK